MNDIVSMKVVGTVLACRRFAKGVNLRVQAEVKAGTKIVQSVTVWDELGTETVQEGARVYAEGYPKLNQYQTKDGETKSGIECIARSFEVLNGAGDDDEI